MKNSHKVKLPVMAWYGDTEMEIDFPESWDVTVCRMKGENEPALNDKKIREAFARPIGSKTIREAAKGKKRVAILFDDLSRATPTQQLVPYILEELAAAGIKDEHIRFIAAIGAHGAMNGISFRKKLGDDILRRFLVYNHNPYENCMPLGFTSRGTPLRINCEFMNCDLKIGIGWIVPHPFGFGGGSKIIIPGVASLETIEANHTRLGLSPTVGMGKYEDNVMLRDMEEAARMSGLDIKVDCILNMKREITALFVGDPIAEHKEGVRLARRHYATELVTDADIAIANCFTKADEMVLAPPVASSLLKKSGGDMVIVAETPEGQMPHYFDRSFGTELGGRGWKSAGSNPTMVREDGSFGGLPTNTRRLTIMSSYPDRVGADWVAPYNLLTWADKWDEVLKMLKATYGNKANVAVIPDATMQFFPETVK